MGLDETASPAGCALEYAAASLQRRGLRFRCRALRFFQMNREPNNGSKIHNFARDFLTEIFLFSIQLHAPLYYCMT
jgi:hypothetical protein